MINIKAYFQYRSIFSYFVLTFLISWGGVLMVIGGFDRIPATSAQLEQDLPWVVLAFTIGPCVAGVGLTAFLDGKTGLQEYARHFLCWQVHRKWYFVALLTIPLLAVLSLSMLSFSSSVFLPGIVTSATPGSLFVSGIMAGLVGGLFEEPGWTGFVLPRLRRRYGVFSAGLLIGVLWGLWHMLVAIWGSGTSGGTFSVLLFLPQLFFYLAVLPAYRILMVWVYDHTQSLLIAMLMHASLTGSILFIFMPAALSELALLSWYFVLAMMLWMMVAVGRLVRSA